MNRQAISSARSLVRQRALASVVLVLTLVLAGSLRPARCEEAVPGVLKEYVSQPDPEFGWRIRDKADRGLGRAWEIELTSQKWQGIVWKHSLLILEPREIKYPNHAILFISGGSIGRRPREDSYLMGLALANLAKARVAMLHQVPNQPLLGNHKEDDLITETWLRYLASGDVEWILQLPMTKSAVRAMDAVQAIAKSEWHGSIQGFVVTGASKRGWTTWLTAVVDPRAVGIAPMVINMLNLRPQMEYQLESWGEYSKQIDDYTRKGLVKQGDLTPREALLQRIVDPYTYRVRLTLPKLVINGTNDPYWVADAAKFYWDDLVGPKWMLEVPNGGHGLEGGRQMALATIAAFFRHVAGGGPWPSLDWKYAEGAQEIVATVQSDTKPKAARLWSAQAPSTDLRQAKWHGEPVAQSAAGFVAKVPKPQQGHGAFYVELRFEQDALPFSLCTLVRRY